MCAAKADIKSLYALNADLTDIIWAKHEPVSGGVRQMYTLTHRKKWIQA